MKAVLGIGNPGRNYQNTRHNIGFRILDKFTEKHSLVFTASKFDYLYADGKLNSSAFFLIKPTTYVNLSGIAAKDFLDHHEVDITDFLVVTDDVNLEEGQVRIRKSGGDGGHNGVHSLIYHLESETFPRIRFGIGKAFAKGEMAGYVLSPFSEENREVVNKQIDFAVELIEKFITNDIQYMLDYYSKSLKNKINSNKGEGK